LVILFSNGKINSVKGFEPTFDEKAGLIRENLGERRGLEATSKKKKAHRRFFNDLTILMSSLGTFGEKAYVEIMWKVWDSNDK